MFKGAGRQLEFQKLLLETSKLARSEPGKEAVLSIKPSVNPQEVERNLSLNETFFKLLSERSIPLDSFPNAEPLLRKLKVEGSLLSVEELLLLLKLLTQSKVLKNFFKSLPERFKKIAFFSQRLTDGGELLKELTKSIDERGEVLDSASLRLREIRKRKSVLLERIREKLTSIVNRNPELCPDRIITEREGRFVILAKPHFVKRFKGIVHDRSSSGQTVYVEPLSVVELNNQLRSLKKEEKEEIYRIVRELSFKAGEMAQEIESSFKALTEIDLRCAVAQMSIKLKGTYPEFKGEFNLKEARHPLIELKDQKAVPIDIKLKKGLLITGPNTGGKTVCLKTLGLLSMMAQSGFLIPAQEGSSLIFIKKWFTDIGDEQSIEQSLSTFSSHIKRISQILKEADESSLVLLDELGAGTDPIEGSSLAVAILKYLKGKGAKVAATTHFSPVKLFAYKDDYYQVASVLFDEKTLKPLYKLAYGIVGKSYALAVAERFGIPKEVIETAVSLMSEEERLAEEIIEALQREYREVEKLKKELKKREQELKEKERRLKEEGSKEIEKFIKELEKKAEEALKERAREKLKSIVISAKNRAEVLKEVKQKGEIKEGDWVKVLPSGRKGKVVKLNREKKVAEVLIGSLKAKVKVSDLEKVEVKERQVRGIEVPQPKSFFPELKLIGMRGEEALKALEEFLDKALIVGVKEVRVIHGYGEGILKRLVREYLKESPYVKSFRGGKPEEGGEGITVVELK